MSLPYSTSRAVFLGNDVTTRFPFSFTVWKDAELAVTVTDLEGKSSLVQGWQVELSPTGGTLVYEHNHAPLPTGYSLAITRAMPFTQEVDLISGTRFDAEAIEIALDKATAERQQLREALSRAVKLPETSLDTPESLVQNLYAARNEAQTAADNAQTSENNAAASASLANSSNASALTSANAAQAWAESTTSPDPTDSTKKSAKSWAEQAGADVTATVALVTAEGDAQVARVEALFTPFPAGGIIIFSGTFGGTDGKHPVPAGATDADEGWALCDGSNGTPDLRGRFIIGAAKDYAQGATGGTASASVSGTTGATTLTVEQIPSHKHSLENSTGEVESYGRYENWLGQRVYVSLDRMQSGVTGGSGAHSHSMSATVSTLPPYYALAYIMKLPTA